MSGHAIDGRAARRTVIARYIMVSLAVITLIVLLFQPAVANQLGYALPVDNGLPCRVHYAGGTYDNDYQCGGVNMTAWMTWTVGQHRFPSGGLCLPAVQARPRGGALKQVAEVSTLLGIGHRVFRGKSSYSSRSVQPLTLYVQNGIAGIEPAKNVGRPTIHRNGGQGEAIQGLIPRNGAGGHIGDTRGIG